ncbi:hypothetical protein [Acetobacter sp. DsW_063]|uniref:hypothetical protein n=1 Tax=Acetobacter sp. DsW_063 TaxID=1514894 RepID=UPI000A3A16C8|nr:hypothetical protein [Acetobacter sp. DsW_063]OUJ16499.1 hypothetical protein HK28_12560 [Acetobacter sp. DsW_063]
MADNANTFVTDAKGRKIEVRELSGSQQSRFCRIAGNAYGDNVWTFNTMMRLRVVKVDDRPSPPFPNSMPEIDGLWDCVDVDAVEAVAKLADEESKKVTADAKNSMAPQDSETVSGS